jgi:hypothetical protein
MGHFQDSNRVDFHRARVLIGGGLRIDYSQSDSATGQNVCTRLTRRKFQIRLGARAAGVYFGFKI